MGALMDSLLTESTIKSAIEEKLGEEVLAAGEVRQGSPPSMMSMMTGTALIGLFKPRASKSLPKHFLLAVTADRVVALKGHALSDEDGNDTGAWVREEIESWPRDEVSLSGLVEDKHATGGTLEIPGARIEVFDPSMGQADRGDVLTTLAKAA